MPPHRQLDLASALLDLRGPQGPGRPSILDATAESNASPGIQWLAEVDQCSPELRSAAKIKACTLVICSQPRVLSNKLLIDQNCYCAGGNSISARICSSSLSAELTRVEIGQIRMGSGGNGVSSSRGSG